MVNSLNLGKIKGIKISIHWTFLILIAWIVLSNYRQDKSNGELTFTLLYVISIFACVTLHELGHALTAKTFGLHTESITLLPIGGVAQIDDLPEKPSQEFLVAIAGPMVNLIIAGMLFGILYWLDLLPDMFNMMIIDGKTFLFSLFIANAVLAVFNLIPAFPMDGGRVLRALLSYKLKRDKATQIAAITGQIIAIGFIGAGIFYNPILVFIGIFIYLGAQSESSHVHSRTLLSGYRVKDMLITKYYTVNPQNTVGEATRLLLAVQAKDFLVTDKNVIQGTINRDAIIQALNERGENTPVREAMNKIIVSFSLEDSADKVYREIFKSRQSIFPVLENGHVIGIVDTENLNEFILVNEARTKSGKNINSDNTTPATV